MSKDTVLKVNGQTVLLQDLAQAWLSKETKFTSVSWKDPASNLSPEDYAKVCLINLTSPGETPTKQNCKLPIRSTPGGPVNLNALRAVAAALGGARGNEVQAPEEAKRKAARTVVRLMREAGIEPGEATLRRAGMSKSDFELEFEIIKADEPKRVIYGVPLVPNRTDSQGDRVTKEEIEVAAWDFMIKSRRYDDQHQKLVPEGDVMVVESYLAPVDFELGGHPVKAGSWVLASKIMSDDLWGRFQKGEFNAYSIKGRGDRRIISQSITPG